MPQEKCLARACPKLDEEKLGEEKLGEEKLGEETLGEEMPREGNFKGAEPWRETLQQSHNSIVELKELPGHLKYAFLEEEKIHPVIISSALDDEQEHSLLSVLRLYKNVIGYSIDDIKGIDEKVCSHRSEERRVGKECTSWCRSRWSPYH